MSDRNRAKKSLEKAIDILLDDDNDWKKLCAEMAKRQPTLFVRVATESSDSWTVHAKLLVESGNKIGAIKYCRNETGLGLREAKEAVEAL